MANGLVCDGCGSHVAFDMKNGRESTTAEESAWITLTATNVRDYHACTRECAKAIIDGEFGEVVQVAYEQIARFAQMMSEHEAGAS